MIREKEFRNGCSNNQCLYGCPAINSVQEGFNVKVFCDVCGSSGQINEEMSWRRMDAGGVSLTSKNAIAAELIRNGAAHTVAFPLLT